MTYERGDIIHRSEPIIYAVCDSTKGRFCDYCLKKFNQPIFDVNDISAHLEMSDNLKRCSQCKILFFCNKNCQKKAWTTFHKLECARLKNCPLGCHELLVARLYMKLKIDGESERKQLAENVGNYLSTFDKLSTHKEKYESDVNLSLALITQKLKMPKFCPDLYNENNVADNELLDEVFWKCTTNLTIIQDFQLVQAAYGVFLSTPVFEHSCDPDAYGSFKGTSWSVRAARKITHNDVEKISLCYLPSWETRKERKKFLKNKLKINCTCNFCSNGAMEMEANEVIDIDKAEASGVLSLSKIYCERRLKNHIYETESEVSLWLDECKRIVKLQRNVLGKYHIYRFKLLDFMFSDFNQLILKEEELKIGLELIDVYKFYYGEHHLFFGYLMFRLALLYRDFQDSKRSYEYFKQANEVFKTTLDEDHTLYLSSKHNLLSLEIYRMMF